MLSGASKTRWLRQYWLVFCLFVWGESVFCACRRQRGDARLKRLDLKEAVCVHVVFSVGLAMRSAVLRVSLSVVVPVSYCS